MDKTLVSRQWIQNNQHNPIDFEKNWVAHFQDCQEKKMTPMEYKRNLRYVEKVIKSYIKVINIKNQKRVERMFKPLSKLLQNNFLLNCWS